jgi:hypothetical protein
MVKELSCFCASCVFEKWEACQNASHVFSWWLIELKLNNTRLVKNQMQQFEDPDDIAYGGDGKELFNLLHIGDNFVVLAT